MLENLFHFAIGLKKKDGTGNYLKNLFLGKYRLLI
jgi:hypothetical protein